MPLVFTHMETEFRVQYLNTHPQKAYDSLPTAVRAYTAFLAYIVQLRVLRMRSALCVLLLVASLNE